MKIIFLKKALPKPDGCCGIEIDDESRDIEEYIFNILKKTSEEGRIWVNKISMFEELGGKRKFIVYNFPANIKISEKLNIKLPALIIGNTIIEGINKEKLEIIREKIEKSKK